MKPTSKLKLKSVNSSRKSVSSLQPQGSNFFLFVENYKVQEEKRSFYRLPGELLLPSGSSDTMNFVSIILRLTAFSTEFCNIFLTVCQQLMITKVNRCEKEDGNWTGKEEVAKERKQFRITQISKEVSSSG